MKHPIYSRALVACVLSALMLTACSQPSSNVSDSGSSSETPFAEFSSGSIEIDKDSEVTLNKEVPPPKITVEHIPLTPDSEMEDSAHIVEFLSNFLRCTSENPAETKCSPEIQELMKTSPNAAKDLNTAMPIYVQTQAQMENMVYIRFAYDAETETISDLFTFEIIEGNLTLTEPDKLAAFVSGGVYEVSK